jgi:malonate-semialdehyde dehydrogenase (acetylating) / methylmalonate-semialdehyde dehydrogenase
MPERPLRCSNLVDGELVVPRGAETGVTSPYTGQTIGVVAQSTATDVDLAVSAAARAFPLWRSTPRIERAAILQRYRQVLVEHTEELAKLVALESGKTPAEAAAGLQRGLEVIDFATSSPNLDIGGALDVSRGVRCEYRREPLGVVVGITPFNFPAMVPLWMMPLSLVVGNTFILKPSDKVPNTALRLAELALEAGVPGGVFSVVNGGKETVEALLAHAKVQAVGFVGSSPVAKSVFLGAATNGKRALCLGGAKNHMIVAPDADDALTVGAVVDSFTGCAGQRCMAGSVLITVGAANRIIPRLVEAAAKRRAGFELGALIDRAAHTRLHQAIAHAEQEGARVLLDGRIVSPPSAYEKGYWLNPTVLTAVSPSMQCAQTELFGPVLAVIEVEHLEDALALENNSPYGNATSIFTRSGATARIVAERAECTMIGVNIGVPVPRDPFSFGGNKLSRFGHGDMTGPGGLEFWSQLKKITSKWALQSDANWMS